MDCLTGTSTTGTSTTGTTDWNLGTTPSSSTAWNLGSTTPATSTTTPAAATNDPWGLTATTTTPAAATNDPWGLSTTTPAATTAGTTATTSWGLGTTATQGTPAVGAQAQVKGDTKFESIPESGAHISKATLKQIEAGHHGETKKSEEIRRLLEGRRAMPNTTKVREDLENLDSAITGELYAMENFCVKVKDILSETDQAYRSWSRHQSSSTGTIYLPSQFHWKKLAEFNTRISLMKKQIEEIDDYLASADQHDILTNPDVLQRTLRANYESLIRLAVRVSKLSELAGKIRKDFIRANPQHRNIFRASQRQDQFLTISVSTSLPGVPPVTGPTGTGTSNGINATNFGQHIAGAIKQPVTAPTWGSTGATSTDAWGTTTTNPLGGATTATNPLGGTTSGWDMFSGTTASATTSTTPAATSTTTPWG